MKRFFAKISGRSVTEAKNRLKSVIKNDRINISQSITLEKMRKEISAVLLKYASGNGQPPQVSVTYQSEALCLVSATVPIEEENDIR
ncbi:MAG: cell division topological specificity factor MinE [Clostridia bacterium]|nr:cell division topological specificity factor MinE [Clostridia bacterium]